MIAKEYHRYLKLEKGLSENSVKAYELDLQRLQAYMDQHNIDIIHASFDDLQAFVFDTPPMDTLIPVLPVVTLISFE